MIIDGLKDLVKISRGVGERQDYIQGGGGNTSVKLDDKLMAIKGSGSLLKNMSETDGFAVIDYSAIMDYHKNTPKNEDRDYNKESMDVAINTTQIVNGEPKRRPSVEAGFHSFLKRCVVHTHSVYANVLTCAKGGVERACEIINDAGFNCIWVKAVNPGYYLTEEIMSKVLEPKKDVNVIIMQNHGIIATDDDADNCLKIHELANQALIKELGLQKFPACKVKQTEGGYISDTEFFINMPKDIKEKLFEIPMYPDQLVYLSNKEKVVRREDEIIYTVNEAEALAIEETICGVAYCMSSILNKEMTIYPMEKENVSYIANWDSEKIRAQAFAEK